MTPRLLDAGTRREIAVRASCDPRTVDRALLGLPIRGLAGHRARAALKAAGFLTEETKANGPHFPVKGGGPLGAFATDEVR